MQWIKTTFHRYPDHIRTPGFIAGAATAILAALLWELVSQAIQSSLINQNVGFYVMAVIALVCLILVAYFLMRIEKLVQNRNYTRFITSKSTRLNLMTDCIKNAKHSIYILSDLSGTEETQLPEHVMYIDALNQVMKDNYGNPDFDIKRIVVPPSTSGNCIEVDPDWIYTAPITQAYRRHFTQMFNFREAVLKHANGPRNVSVILIDNKYLFWKPELTYGDKALDTLLDGGLYLEDYTQDGMVDFAESFLKMHSRAVYTNPDKFYWTKPKT
jgi:hypothetical protein